MSWFIRFKHIPKPCKHLAFGLLKDGYGLTVSRGWHIQSVRRKWIALKADWRYCPKCGTQYQAPCGRCGKP